MDKVPAQVVGRVRMAMMMMLENRQYSRWNSGLLNRWPYNWSSYASYSSCCSAGVASSRMHLSLPTNPSAHAWPSRLVAPRRVRATQGHCKLPGTQPACNHAFAGL